MVLHGLLAKAAPTVVTGAVGVAAYQALRKGVAKVPLARGDRHRDRVGHALCSRRRAQGQHGAEQARLTAADVIAEAKERIGEDVTPLVVVDSDSNGAH